MSEHTEPFNPDRNLPDCMMPDGGHCCAGYVALVDDWRRRRNSYAKLVKTLEEIARQHIGDEIEEHISNDGADFEGAYESIVKLTRAALSKAAK